MSLDSNIWIETQDAPEQVQRLIAERTAFEAVEDMEDMKQMVAEATYLNIAPILPREAATEAAGVTADIHLFLTATDTHSRAWGANQMRAVMALLHAYPGDLLYEYLGYPALVRKNGRIVLDRGAGLWDEGVEPEVLSLIDLPYEWGVIPS